MIEYRLKDGRRTGQHGDPFRRHALHHRHDVEHGVGEDRGTTQDAGQHARLQPRRVEERIDHEVAVASAQADQLGPGQVGADAGTVPQHGALGLAGGARGEDDVGGVVLGHGGQAACHLLTVGVGRPGLELGEGRAPRPRRSLQHHDLFEGFEGGLVGQQRHQVGAEQVGHGEEQARPGGTQDVARLLAAVSGVERHQHRTDGVDGETRDHPCGTVGCPQGHAVAPLDAARHERARHGVDAFGHVPKREPGRPVDEGFVVPVVVGCLLQRLGDRPRLSIGRHAVRLNVVRHGGISRPPPTTAGSRSRRRSVRAHRARPRPCALRAMGSVGHDRRPGRRSAPGCRVSAPAGRPHPSV